MDVRKEPFLSYTIVDFFFSNKLAGKIKFHTSRVSNVQSHFSPTKEDNESSRVYYKTGASSNSHDRRNARSGSLPKS